MARLRNENGDIKEQFAELSRTVRRLESGGYAKMVADKARMLKSAFIIAVVDPIFDDIPPSTYSPINYICSLLRSLFAYFVSSRSEASLSTHP